MKVSEHMKAAGADAIDPIELSVFQNAVHSIAEEMGAALRRTALSPNIKERRDYSCAVFDGAARVIAMGDHMPVHLGSMPMSVETAVAQLSLGPGDIAILNDPYGGGTHLPDITMVAPVFVEGETEAAFYIANRAHHADVGGMFPGSMGPAREIFQEGLRIPPVRLVRGGKLDEEMLALLLLNVRTPEERRGDLDAQMGACRVGEERVLELVRRYGRAKVPGLIAGLLDYSERLVRAELRALPAGRFEAEDWLDGDGVPDDDDGKDAPIRIAAALTIDPDAGSIAVDFAGSAAQVEGSVNAVRAITLSACFYMLRCLLPENAPATAGILRPLTLATQAGSVVDARSPAPVAGGNVETSQRIVDVLLRALAQTVPERVPAASAGTMSNLTIGGFDRRCGAGGGDGDADVGGGRPFTYYETTAGGMGARYGLDGISGVQTHMTNSLNTPIEALEYAYPLRVWRYGYRERSGGVGKYRGGDGLVREIEMLAPAQVTLLADRRRYAPYGLAGGLPGATGKASIVRLDRKDENLDPEDGEIEELPGKCSVRLASGDRLRLETPGGGGWGEL